MKRLILLFSLLSVLLHGYQFSTGDQAVYMPFIYKVVDPGLYRHDKLINLMPEQNYSLFFSLIGHIIRFTHIDPQWLFLVLYFLFHFLLLYAVYSLSYLFIKNRTTAHISMLLLLLPKYVGGTTITTLDNVFLARFSALPVLLWGYYQLISGRFILAALFAGTAFLIHPFSGLLLGCYILGFIILERHFWARLYQVVFLFIPVVFWAMIKKLPQAFFSRNPIIIPLEWWNIIIQRTAYNFLTQWQLTGFASLFLIVFLCFLSINKPFWIIVKRTFIIAALTTLFHLVTVEWLKISLIAQLQLLRIWLIPAFLAYISAAGIIVKFKSRFIALILFLLLFSNFGRARFFQGIEFPHAASRDWDLAQIWVRDHTPKNSLILTPPHRVGFRIHSQRSIVGEIKDGSSSLYSYEFAKIWLKRMQDLHPLGSKTSAEILKLKQEYNFDYLVTFADQPHADFNPVYQNSTFIVYKI